MLTVKITKIYNVLDFFATPQIYGIYSLDLKKKLWPEKGKYLRVISPKPAF